MNKIVFLTDRKAIVFSVSMIIMIIGTVFLSGFDYRQTSEEKKQVELYRAAEALFKKGEGKFIKGNYPDAEKYIKNALILSPCMRMVIITFPC